MLAWDSLVGKGKKYDGINQRMPGFPAALVRQKSTSWTRGAASGSSRTLIRGDVPVTRWNRPGEGFTIARCHWRVPLAIDGRAQWASIQDTTLPPTIRHGNMPG